MRTATNPGTRAASVASAATKAAKTAKTAKTTKTVARVADRAAALPQRVQLKRSAGWKMPANTVKVDRTTRWGNPFTIAECGSAAIAVAQHGRWMRGEIGAPGGVEPPARDALRTALGGRNLACWCALNGPCHADLLLVLANKR
jgi:ribosomal protein L13E